MFNFNVSLSCNVQVRAIAGKLVKGFHLFLSLFLVFGRGDLKSSGSRRKFWASSEAAPWEKEKIPITGLLVGSPVVIQPNIACLYVPVTVVGKLNPCPERL